MYHYKLNIQVEEDLTRIFEYGIGQFGLEQADKYYEMFFECFSKIHTDVKTFNCKISEAHWQQNGNQIIFTITADRFLRNMVRAIVGTLINVGIHKTSLSDFRTIIESKNRNNAGFSVPAHGLYLTKVKYPYI
mgnify:CR=1 FL=1